MAVNAKAGDGRKKQASSLEEETCQSIRTSVAQLIAMVPSNNRKRASTHSIEPLIFQLLARLAGLPGLLASCSTSAV
jgi:hypothetical protein